LFFMPLPDLLPIQPFTRPMRGEVALPGSKSLTNRALPLAALCDQPVTLTGALFSEDTHLMSEALRTLGFAVDEDASNKTIRVAGRDGEFPVERADLFVGLAGTAARFLTALCAAAPRGIYRLDGVPQMRKRPMKPLIDALRALGADIRCPGEEGFFPLEIHARGLAGGTVELDASESSQLLSALLMVAPLARDDVHVTLRGSVRWAYVDMTARVMQAFTRDGQTLVQKRDAQSFTVLARRHPYRLVAEDARYAIEPDASAASYFLALPIVTGGTLRLLGAQDAKQGLQGDTEFANVIREVGGDVRAHAGGLDVSFARGSTRRSQDRNFKAISDTFLTLAAIAPLLDGPTRISGIAHTRKQETDRVAGMARELTRLGQRVIESEDALEIHPQPLRADETIETYHDHRFAMSFGVLGCYDLSGNGQPWLTIRDPACCAKTFPDFFDLLETLRQKSLAR
jgi:3-phosphoshikimate 1-carboxyvinyltransferase